MDFEGLLAEYDRIDAAATSLIVPAAKEAGR